jgi:hypothetical protein
MTTAFDQVKWLHVLVHVSSAMPRDQVPRQLCCLTCLRSCYALCSCDAVWTFISVTLCLSGVAFAARRSFHWRHAGAVTVLNARVF